MKRAAERQSLRVSRRNELQPTCEAGLASVCLSVCTCEMERPKLTPTYLIVRHPTESGSVAIGCMRGG